MNDIPEELQQRIAAYIDGELPPDEAARLEVYLANTDPVLADRIVGMLADKVQVRALPKPHAPADLSARIMEQVERRSLLREDEPTPRQPWWQSRTAIAAGLAVVLGGFSYFVASYVLRAPSDKNWTGGPTASGPAAPGPLALKSTGDRIPATELSRAQAQITQNGARELATVAAETKPSAAEAPLEGGALAKADVPAPPVAPAAKATELLDQSTTQFAAAEPRQYPNNSIAAPSVAPGAAGVASNASGGYGGGGGFGGGGGGGGGGGRGGRGGGGAGGLAAAGGTGGAGGAAGGAGRGAGGGAGAAAGRGAAGGARGGRGGAAATPSPALAVTGMQSLAPTTDNTVRTLADITRDGRGPMVVTFLAQNDQDYAKLAAALAAYASANLRQNGGANNIAPSAPQANLATQPDSGNVQRPQQAPAPQNSLPQNNTSVDALANNSGAVSAGVNTNGVVVFNNSAAAGNNFANGNNGNAQFGVQNNFNRGNNLLPNNTPSLNNQLYNDQNINNNFDNSRLAAQNLQLATARGGPYRVSLRADQVEELARTFRMAIVARGDVAVQFRTLGDRAPITADATERSNLLQKAGLTSDTSGSNQTAAGSLAEAQRSAPPAAPAAPAVAPAPTATTTPTMQAQTIAQGKILPVTIDCVITMEPAPPAPPAPPAQTPAP